MSARAITVRKFEGVELSAWGGEYLARDTEVARWLHFDHPENIRNLIKRNAEELRRYGVLCTVEETSGSAGGRPATVYYLNKEQALLAAVLSRAPRAADVRFRLIKAFDAARIDATDSVIFNQLFLPKPEHTEYLWSVERLAPIAKLYGVKYEGGRAPLETRNIQRVIYDLILGNRHLKRLREKYPDPPGSHGEPYIYDHFHPEVRAAFELHLDRTVLALARSVATPAAFLDALKHEYTGRPLQLALVPPRQLKPKKPEGKK